MTTSDDDLGCVFAPPPFKPAEALVDLRKRLRELRVLTERGAGSGERSSWELKGAAVIEIATGAASLDVKLARQPARTPQWEPRSLKSGADVRGFVDEVRRRLARWEDE